jgi:hypothetical protein
MAHRKKGKAIPVTDPGGPYDCETLRLTDFFLENSFTEDVKVTPFDFAQ